MRLEQLADLETPEGVEVHIARTYIAQREVRTYGNLVGDHAAVHRNKRIARDYEFMSPPVIGTHIAAIALQFANVAHMPLHQKMKYSLPIYARRWVEWYRKKEGDHILITAKQNECIRAEFISSQAGPPKASIENPWCSAQTQLKEHTIRKLMKQIKGNSEESARNALAYAFMPAALVTLVQQRCGNPLFFALHRSSEVDYWRSILPGEAEIRIYEASKRPARNAQVYTFQSELVQGKEVAIGAKMICITQEEIDLKRLRNK